MDNTGKSLPWKYILGVIGTLVGVMVAVIVGCYQISEGYHRNRKARIEAERAEAESQDIAARGTNANGKGPTSAPDIARSGSGGLAPGPPTMAKSSGKGPDSPTPGKPQEPPPAPSPKIAGIKKDRGDTTPEQSPGAKKPDDTPTQPRLPFREDFAAFKEGETTKYSKNATVTVGTDGRKWLVPTANGQQPVGFDVELLANASIEFDYHLQPLVPRRSNPSSPVLKCLSGISLIDESGAVFRIEWTIDDALVGIWSSAMTAPSGGKHTGSSSRDQEPGGTVRIAKKGPTIEIVPGGFDKPLQSSGRPLIGDVSDYKKLTRFEIELYKGPGAILSITNIKVGSGGTVIKRESPTGRPKLPNR
jgi:hypothetical protein